jgi:NADPH:quinone reductase-like Zn-dependent oxidoreductase
MMTPNGAFGEYGVAPEHTTIHLPADVTFEEAATIPLAAMTAALGLYQRLGLPLPWLPAQERVPLVVYSAASAVGAFAVKLAILSNIHPIICIAGRGIAYVETLIDSSQGDVVIDYRQGDAGVVKALEQVLGSDKLLYAFDAVSDKGSFQNLMKVMDHKKGKIAVVLARKRYEGIPDTFQKFFTQVVSTDMSIDIHGPLHGSISYESQGLWQPFFPFKKHAQCIVDTTVLQCMRKCSEPVKFHCGTSGSRLLA